MACISNIAGIAALCVAGGAIALLAAGRAGALGGHPPADLGLHLGRLKPPSDTRNSVSSQAGLYEGDGARYAAIEPLRFEGASADAMARLAGIVSSMPGARVVESRPEYLYAQFTTRWLRFVDDAEFSVAPGTQRIELRSASRLGREDFGVNRRRIDAIRTRFAQR